jgi:hypothetical protein
MNQLNAHPRSVSSRLVVAVLTATIYSAQSSAPTVRGIPEGAQNCPETLQCFLGSSNSRRRRRRTILGWPTNSYGSLQMLRLAAGPNYKPGKVRIACIFMQGALAS